jgi:hypothetical protein
VLQTECLLTPKAFRAAERRGRELFDDFRYFHPPYFDNNQLSYLEQENLFTFPDLAGALEADEFYTLPSILYPPERTFIAF